MFNRKRKLDEQLLTARRQTIHDPALRQRVVDAIDHALSTAGPGQLRDDDGGNGVRYVSARWSYQQDGDTLAHKSIDPDGEVTYEVSVDPGDHHDRFLDRAWLIATTREGGDVVTWMPGLGFEDAGEFTDWFARLAAPTS